jgi:hypothetical protein
MRRFFVLLLAAAGVAGSAGCPAPPTALARAQETAQQFNLDARFGRSELLLEHVAPAARDGFAAHHRAWGTGVRLADVELAGTRPHGEHELDVIVRVAWYRPDEQELRVTTVEQRWQELDGWKLAEEKRLEGDMGLLGEPIVYASPSEGQQRARFPTVTLSGKADQE